MMAPGEVGKVIDGGSTAPDHFSYIASAEDTWPSSIDGHEPVKQGRTVLRGAVQPRLRTRRIRKYLSNVEIRKNFRDDIIVHKVDLEKHGFSAANLVKILNLAFRYDGIVVFNPNSGTILLSILGKLIRLGELKIVFFDLLLKKPATKKELFVARVKSLLFKYVDRFLFVQKDISGYRKYYGISEKNCSYIPFKANNINLINVVSSVDGGYLLACGASHRNYDLLAAAIKLYPCKTFIVLPEEKVAKYHHSSIDEEKFRNMDSVKIIRHDFSRDTWYEFLAGCRAVVLPISSDAIQCAGISVYLEAMAFGKPVVITEGFATRGLLDEDMAAICPPDDPLALANAIRRVMEDEEYRQKLMLAGRRYVCSLGGEERLVDDILRAAAYL